MNKVEGSKIVIVTEGRIERFIVEYTDGTASLHDSWDAAMMAGDFQVE